jgi:hypothetical protein
MIYYRVAWKTNQSPVWQWKSTKLTSLNALFLFLRMYSALPQDHLRVFSSSSLESLDEMLMRENNGWASTSVTAEQFLHERGIRLRELTGEVSERGTEENQEMGSIAVTTKPLRNEQSTPEHSLDKRPLSSLERRRAEVECGAGGDHDVPYTFALPLSMPQTLAWIRLLVKVQRGELEL